jgi:hypothetical protein
VDRHLQLVVGVVGPSTVMRGEVAYRLSQTVGRQPPRTGAEWSIAVVHIAVAVGQILRPAKLDDSCGDGSDDTRRSKSGARRTTAMVALVGEDERAVLWQKLLTRASFSPTIRPRSSA